MHSGAGLWYRDFREKGLVVVTLHKLSVKRADALEMVWNAVLLCIEEGGEKAEREVLLYFKCIKILKYDSNISNIINLSSRLRFFLVFLLSSSLWMTPTMYQVERNSTGHRYFCVAQFWRRNWCCLSPPSYLHTILFSFPLSRFIPKGIPYCETQCSLLETFHHHHVLYFNPFMHRCQYSG